MSFTNARPSLRTKTTHIVDLIVASFQARLWSIWPLFVHKSTIADWCEAEMLCTQHPRQCGFKPSDLLRISWKAVTNG
jgi:hypothetical protein